MKRETSAKLPQTKGFRSLSSVDFRRIGGEESVDNETALC